MPFNGSGTFTRIYNWVTDVNQGNTTIQASRLDGEDDNFASGLSNCITKDGQTVISQNIPFNSKKITGLANGVNIDDAINLGQLQNNQYLYLGTTGGSADAYTLTVNPSIGSYASTQQFIAKISATNTTTTPYLQISGIPNPSSTAVIKKLNASKTEVALEVGDLLINGIYKFQRNSTNDAWIVLNPEKPFLNLVNATNATFTNATNTVQGVVYLDNLIGLVNDGSDLNQNIGFTAGTFKTSAGNQIYLPTIIKRIQASGSWTAGYANNGLDTGVRTASTFYRTYVIQNNSTGAYDILFSLSTTSPTVPSGYTNLGIMDYAFIRVNSSNNIAISKWHPNDKKLVLGASQQITFVSSTAGSGNATILNTTEPLELDVKLSIGLTTTGFSDFAAYGSEQDGTNLNDCLVVGTNNGFTAHNNGQVYTSDGKIYWKNFTTAGGVSNQAGHIKAIKIRR